MDLPGDVDELSEENCEKHSIAGGQEGEDVSSEGEATRVVSKGPRRDGFLNVFQRQRREQAKSGSDTPLCPPQRHIRTLAGPESLHPPRAGLANECQSTECARMEGGQNLVVYDCLDPNPFSKSQPDGRTADGELEPYWVLRGPNETTLLFESRFESGNLRRAIQVAENEYDLLLRPDINSVCQVQWFYFRVRNVRRGIAYKFNIVNLEKPSSLYNSGMRPLYYSVRDAEERGQGWVRVGWDICYYPNLIKKRGGGNYFTLSFTLSCGHNDDTVYLAYCYPYTYSDLQEYLAELERDPQRSVHVRRRPLCQTLAHNTCEILTITAATSDVSGLHSRQGVVVTARVHPGETTGSWMVKGLIDFLTSEAPEAVSLRERIVFKVIPMLNPDGVVSGNYRCSMAGVDLNRQWTNPSRRIHPTIYWSKQVVQRMMDDRGVLVFCDFHGHSRKHNVFMYGCDNSSDPTLHLRERILPRLLSLQSPNFSYSYCNFKVQKSKESSARVAVRRQFGVVYAYTMEASVSGSNVGSNAGRHFNQADYEAMGVAFCRALLDLVDSSRGVMDLVTQELRGVSLAQEAALDESSEGSEAEDDTLQSSQSFGKPPLRPGSKKNAAEPHASSRLRPSSRPRERPKVAKRSGRLAPKLLHRRPNSAPVARPVFASKWRNDSTSSGAVQARRTTPVTLSVAVQDKSGPHPISINVVLPQPRSVLEAKPPPVPARPSRHFVSDTGESKQSVDSRNADPLSMRPAVLHGPDNECRSAPGREDCGALLSSSAADQLPNSHSTIPPSGGRKVVGNRSRLSLARPTVASLARSRSAGPSERVAPRGPPSRRKDGSVSIRTHGHKIVQSGRRRHRPGSS